MSTNSNDYLRQVSDKMDLLLRLQALNLVKEIPEEQKKIELLDSFGFRPVDIAKFLNKTPENINVVLSTIRKKKGEKRSVSSSKVPSVSQTSGKGTSLTPVGQSNMEERKK